MRQVEKCFNMHSSSKYKESGFRKKNLTFARISDDTVQAFTFEKVRYDHACTVEFGIWPLCMPTPLYLDAGSYRLNEVIVSAQPEVLAWTFDPHSDESIHNCVESVLKAIDCVLLPFFDVCKNSQTALNELIKIEEKIENNRLNILQRLGDSDCARPWQERSLFDPKKYYIALKSQNYSYAHRFLSQQILWYTQELRKIERNEGVHQPEIVKVRFEAALAKYQEHMDI